MTQLQTMREFWKVWRSGQNLGDAAILKVSAFGGFEPSESARQALAAASRPIPDFAKIDFQRFTAGTLGYEYGRFMERNRLQPFGFSGQYQALLERHHFAVWYATVHDLIHVLTGFDTSWMGEGGVWGFVAGQDLSPQASRAIRLARFFYPIFNRGQSHAIHAAIAKGLEMGKAAAPVVQIDFEAELASTLDEVRNRYRISGVKA